MEMYRIINTSSSSISIGGANIAPAANIVLSAIPLSIRGLEEQGFLKIETIKPPVVLAVATEIITTKKNKKRRL